MSEFHSYLHEVVAGHPTTKEDAVGLGWVRDIANMFMRREE
jgi:hypothetical protein